MKRYVQHEFLKISHFQTVEWDHPVHNHNHVELIFVHRGKGKHVINGVEYPYNGKTLFLLGLSDYHTFTVEEETEFTFLKFTNIYLKGINNIEVQQGWNECIDGLLASSGKNYEELLKTDYEKNTLDTLIKLIVGEWSQEESRSAETIFFLIQAVMAVVKRNSCQVGQLSGSNKPDEKIASLVNYIHNRIYNKEEVQIEHLAATFGYSKNYLGIYFKEQLGVTLRDYVSQYKMKLIENRLLHSAFTIKEISYELGFTDLSHFNKFFQRHKSISPKEFRSRFDRNKASAAVAVSVSEEG